MFSYQLYSSRNFPPLADTLKMLAEVGYKDTEGFGGLYSDEATLAALAEGLKANGLTMSTGHFGLPMIEANPDFVIKVAKARWHDQGLLPACHARPTARPTAPAGVAFGARLQKAGAPLVAAGLGFGWHNHDFEFAGAAPMARCRCSRFWPVGRSWNGKWTWLGSCAVAATRWPGSRRSRAASPPPMSRTSPPRAKTWTRMAGPMSATAPSTGRQSWRR